MQTPLTEPADLVHVEDHKPQPGNARLFRSDKVRLKDTVQMRDPHLLSATTRLLVSMLPPEYRHLVVSSVTRSKSHILFVHTKGKNSAWCPYKQAIHKSDRSFFMVYTKKHLLTVRCHNPECMKQLTQCDDYYLHKKKATPLPAAVSETYRRLRISLDPTNEAYVTLLSYMYPPTQNTPPPPPVAIVPVSNTENMQRIDSLRHLLGVGP